MTNTYRAAYVGETVLTLPEHAHLDDDSLLAEAWAEAQRGGITRGDVRITREDIRIGEWKP